MNQVKLTVRRRFPALARVWQRIRYHPRLAGSPEQVFAEFYRDNKWGDAESVSGAGANPGSYTHLARPTGEPG